jgi:Flp pilus assembly protein TadG
MTLRSRARGSRVMQRKVSGWRVLGAIAGRDEGGVAVSFAVAISVLAFFAGVAIDHASAYRVKSEVQRALDSGVLAATALALDADAEAVQSTGKKFYNASLANFGFNGGIGQPTFTRTGVIVEGTVNAVVDTMLTKVLGFQAMPLTVNSAASPQGKGMELMLVVDVSGSMSGSKIGALRNAATALVDAIYGGANTRADTWIGITPFSGRVNVHDYAAGWMTGAGPGWANRTCTDRRSPPNVENDEPPSTELFPYYWATSGYSGTQTCPAPKVLGLTAEKSTITSRINTLVATAGTSTQVGMVWGWRMLSPKWQGLWGDPDLPKTNADSPGKYVIIMTDGENFAWEAGDDVNSPLGDPGMTDEEADQRLLRECTAMKAEGITIFTVAFDMGTSLTSLYQACASTPSYHFDVQSNQGLIDTFEKLGLTIAGNSVRLVN